MLGMDHSSLPRRGRSGRPVGAPHRELHESFLEAQYTTGRALAATSDLFELVPVAVDAGTDFPARYLLRFTCRGLVRIGPDQVAVAEDFTVGICFPRDYLHRVEPRAVATWLAPRQAFHPNIDAARRLVCPGRIVPGTPLVDLVHQVFAVVSWQHVDLSRLLDAEAGAWARVQANRMRLPIDDRRLAWRHAPPVGGPS